MKSYISCFFKTVLILISGITVLSLVVTKTTTGHATFFGIKPIFVPTPSMMPAIQPFSIVIGKALTNKDELKVGDIVVYEKEEVLFAGSSAESTQTFQICHRIVGITKDGKYKIKGDNNLNADEPKVKREQIVYKIIWNP